MSSTFQTNAAHPEGIRLRTDSTPWYRQFWPWFLIALPAISVVASFASLALAIRNADEIVSEPGYELSRFAVEHPVAKHGEATATTAPELQPDAAAEPLRNHP